MAAPSSWGFYGRGAELEHLQSILRRGRWFFARVSGRRRIGKTVLIQEALRATGSTRVLYVQVPDAGPTGVLSAVADAMDAFGIDPGRFARPATLLELARTIDALARAGYVIALDEFQYFSREALHELTSYLQAVVDELSRDAASVTGGLFVLGSIHTELVALLENRDAPLYNRTTDRIELRHLEISSVQAILREHADATPERLLFLWNLFEGVPKFYRDCFEQGVLGASRAELLERMFFHSSSPLRSEVLEHMKKPNERHDVPPAWVDGLATPVSAIDFRPLPELVAQADARLVDAEGVALERLVGVLYEERSRKAVGDFSLTERIQGYWNRQGIEIDLVAVDEDARRIRFGTCKRSASKLWADLDGLGAHVQRFLGEHRRFQEGWRVEKVAIAPVIDDEVRTGIEARGFVVQDLRDLTAGL
jgi:AAA+ ATPase superfamily predicted ATPase